MEKDLHGKSGAVFSFAHVASFRRLAFRKRKGFSFRWSLELEKTPRIFPVNGFGMGVKILGVVT